MRIRAIRLSDVRRFDRPVAVEGIGDGLNLLSAPNEAGKSTLFDALHAAFFLPHRSQAKEAKALRPRVGGAPEVTVEIECAEGRYEIAKRWFSRPMAEVRRLPPGGGAPELEAKADEAEARIARLVGAADGRGPAGLLWVRQGEQGLGGDPGLRRDLLSSVTGEVEALTGGRRMDRARAKAQAELDRLATSTGRPKTGGPWKAAQDEMEALEAEVARLTADAARLHDDLARRRAVRRELAELTEPAAVAAREAALQAATAAHADAERHAERLRAAVSAETMARLTLEATRDRLARLRHAEAERQEAAAAAQTAADAHAAAAAERAAAAEALRAARAAAETAAQARAEADRALALSHAAARAEDQRRRRQALSDALSQAEELRRLREAAEAEAKLGPDAKALRRLEDLAADLRARRAARDREAAALVMRYAPGAAPATLDGAPLPEGARTPIPDGGALELPGLGTLTIEPGRGADSGAVAAAEKALAEALKSLSQDGLDAARAAHDRRHAAETRLREADARLAALAPDGLPALRQALAALPEPAETEALPLPQAEAAAETARAAETAALAAQAEADRDDRAAEQAETRAAAAADALASRLSRAANTLETLADRDAVALEARIATETAALSEAEAARAALAEAAPDLEAAEAELARARGVARNAAQTRERLEQEQVALTTAIELRASDAVEEELADARARLARTETVHDRLAFEVQVLQRLLTALDEARSAARDRWFAPVMAELRPLLSLLWEDADLRFDEAEVAPAALLRRGADEPFDSLSGGTQEQIAILVRLAFARMLATGGQPAPVILDDALVHTDDDRIERMFRALHRQARDMQILVFSCRQRAFRDLGARTLAFVEDA
ncbi:AAA family ATPase [Albimonas pacifica]|uniref:DNA repair exonuclease SbcCD ATPase subunit n=1 Tax=Albimonas pacifica TaxID=1114924 RepID=A0A1I3FDE4_9RHOB|nr:ATP-binding protein [Albimonas pacifica]SFI09253.1 DNA repair exonuclease SbcCD ATPase subunit [Albimonas pacifica]